MLFKQYDYIPRRQHQMCVTVLKREASRLLWGFHMLWSGKDAASDSTHRQLMYCDSLSIIFVFRSLPLPLCCRVFLSALCHNHKRSVRHAAGLLHSICLVGSLFLPYVSFFHGEMSSEEPSHVKCWSGWRLKSTGLKSNFLVWALNQRGQIKDVNHQRYKKKTTSL